MTRFILLAMMLVLAACSNTAQTSSTPSGQNQSADPTPTREGDSAPDISGDPGSSFGFGDMLEGQELARELNMVLVVPLYERDGVGVYYNTAAVIDADGTYKGKYRKTHIPHLPGFWEKFYFRPGNLGYPVFDTAVGKVGVYICHDRHFPEGARALGLNGAEIVFIPSATSRGLSQHLWRIEQTSHAIFNTYFVGTINRVGIEEYGDDDFYGESYFCTPKGQFVGDLGSAHDEELIVRDLDLSMIQEVRDTWHFYFNRRPDQYGDLVRDTVSVKLESEPQKQPVK